MDTWSPNPEQTQAFITRWQEGGGTECAMLCAHNQANQKDGSLQPGRR